MSNEHDPDLDDLADRIARLSPEQIGAVLDVLNPWSVGVYPERWDQHIAGFCAWVTRAPGFELAFYGVERVARLVQRDDDRRIETHNGVRVEYRFAPFDRATADGVCLESGEHTPVDELLRVALTRALGAVAAVTGNEPFGRCAAQVVDLLVDRLPSSWTSPPMAEPVAEPDPDGRPYVNFTNAIGPDRAWALFNRTEKRAVLLRPAA